LVLIVQFIPKSGATGKGPVGSYAINHQYVVVSDSNFDALFVVDVLSGSGVVAAIPLHSADLDPPTPTDQPGFGAGGADHMKSFRYWVDPTGVASCDECKFLYFTSQKEPNLGYVELDRPLLEMAREHDFGSLQNLEGKSHWWRPLWLTSSVESSAMNLLRQSDEVPPEDIADFRPSKFRMLEVHRDGSRGYLTHYDLGVLTFTLDMSNGGLFDEFVGFLPLSDASSISGLTLTPDGESHLIITAKTKAYVASVTDRESNVPKITQTIELQTMCGIHFKDGKELPMNFRDAVMDASHGDIFAIGKPYGSSGTTEEGFGAVLFRLSRDSEGKYNECVNVANKLGNGRGWRDGHAEDVRFTRPHSMLRLLEDQHDQSVIRDRFLLPDIDNRGIRRVDLDREGDVEVSSVPYDDDMWRSFYGETKSLTATRLQAKTLILPVSLGKPNFATHSDASVACSTTATSGIKRRLCRVDEARNGFDEIKDAMRTSPLSKTYVRAWTDTPCHGCWLHYPGFCKEGEGWDEAYRMVAHFDISEKNQFRMRSECTLQDESIGIVQLCCEEIQEEDGGDEDIE